jgi:hypothetical protein
MRGITGTRAPIGSLARAKKALEKLDPCEAKEPPEESRPNGGGAKDMMCGNRGSYRTDANKNFTVDVL